MDANRFITSSNVANQALNSLLKESGRIIANSQYPDEIEYYLCAIELVDPNTQLTTDYFVFPIHPDNIRISDQKIQNVTKTSNGLVSLENSTFTPKQISISGNFGRKFRILAGDGSTLPNSVSNDEVQKGIADVRGTKTSGIKLPDFNLNYKSGYGMTKILEKLFQKSSRVNNNNPLQMFLYCYAFNCNFLVQPLNVQFSQNKSMNMIWEYNLNVTALAPADSIKSTDKYKTTLSRMASEAFISKGVQVVKDLVGNEKNILDNQIKAKLSLNTDQIQTNVI